jgi:NADPH-dependent glutamate synthase beta subunit-like oxidoreductase
MTLGRFEHVAARSIDEAAALGGGEEGAPGGEAAFIAGGTDLLGILKDRVHRSYPARLVGLKPLRALSYLREDGEGLKVGALATLAEIERSPAVRERYALLADAARSVASPQVRNMATIGGNICQEPRCWYYRYPEDGFHCLRKGGRECSALLGENRFHSVFGAARVGRPACSDECPGGVEVAPYMAEVRRGDLGAAARILLRNNPMPAITGRVCPHYCERGCNRGSLDEAVSIRAVERGIGDYVLEHADALYDMPAAESGKRIAVVGSGPAGLAAAFYLRKAGHAVRVFDRRDEAGGMLRYSIPAYRLPPAVLKSLIASYERAGVAFELGAEIGSPAHPLEGLRKDYDAVFLDTGAWEQKSLRIEGAELLESGIDFLAGVRGDGTDGPVAGDRGVAGESVLVVGGGNVAVDVAITARRLGARSVTMACLESRDEMPAFPEEIEQALEEGVRILPSWGPKRVIAAGGAVEGMELVACDSVFDGEGRFAPAFDEARRLRVDARRILLAIGQSAELGYLGGLLGAERGRIRVDEASQETEVKGLFAGGDAATGPASVIAAVAAGRRAAAAIDASLSGPSAEELDRFDEDSGAIRETRVEALREKARLPLPERPAEERCLDAEDVATLDAEGMAREADRCIDCSCVAVNASDIAPALVALGASIATTRRVLEAEDFFAVRRRGTTRLGRGELVTEIRIPAQRAGSRFAFHKFRARAAIDFPIVSVASILTIADGRIASARLAFGAVSPLPLRAYEVERFLVGRIPDEETALEAGKLATRGAFPLEKNAYKLQILRGLVRKALLGLR